MEEFISGLDGKDAIAFAFSAYVVARIVVALTPTPKDDAAMEEVSIFVRALAGLFGLNLRQGRKAPAPEIPNTDLEDTKAEEGEQHGQRD